MRFPSLLRPAPLRPVIILACLLALCASTALAGPPTETLVTGQVQFMPGYANTEMTGVCFITDATGAHTFKTGMMTMHVGRNGFFFGILPNAPYCKQSDVTCKIHFTGIYMSVGKGGVSNEYKIQDPVTVPYPDHFPAVVNLGRIGLEAVDNSGSFITHRDQSMASLAFVPAYILSPAFELRIPDWDWHQAEWKDRNEPAYLRSLPGDPNGTGPLDGRWMYLTDCGTNGIDDRFYLFIDTNTLERTETGYKTKMGLYIDFRDSAPDFKDLAQSSRISWDEWNCRDKEMTPTRFMVCEQGVCKEGKLSSQGPLFVPAHEVNRVVLEELCRIAPRLLD